MTKKLPHPYKQEIIRLQGCGSFSCFKCINNRRCFQGLPDNVTDSRIHLGIFIQMERTVFQEGTGELTDIYICIAPW